MHDPNADEVPRALNGKCASERATRWTSRASLFNEIARCVTRFAPHKAPKSIVAGKLTFDERVVLHRVAGGGAGGAGGGGSACYTVDCADLICSTFRALCDQIRPQSQLCEAS